MDRDYSMDKPMISFYPATTGGGSACVDGYKMD
jgi:hypothetical protein